MELEKMVRRMILESLGVEKYWEEQFNSTECILKIMKYNSPNSPEKKHGLKAHIDRNLVTLLYDNGIDGLEVQTKDGTQWIPVKTINDSFIVMIGESFTAWSNGRMYATHHRVTASGYRARYSLGLFSIYKEGHAVKAPEELVDEEHPLLYKPFDYFDFLRYYTEQYNIKDRNKSIMTYAGVV